MYDMVVIGLGPAGSTFARNINKNLSVLCIDQKNHNNSKFKKNCGGLLNTDANKLLSSFKISVPKKVLADPQLFSVQTIDLNSDVVKTYPRFYINMDRHLFDMWLISLIPPNVEVVLDSKCTKILRRGNFFEITYRTNGVTKVVKSKNIIGADGANSLVRRTFFKEHKIKTYLSIQEWYEDKSETPTYSCIFDNTITDSYCWSLSKDDKFIFGGAFPVKTAKKSFELMKKKLKKYNFKLDNPVKREACLVLTPEKWGDFCCGSKNIYLIGEAGGFISPSSLEGISHGFKTGYALSENFNRGKNILRGYERDCIKIKLYILSKKMRMPFMYNRKMRKLVMKSGLTTLKMKK